MNMKLHWQLCFLKMFNVCTFLFQYSNVSKYAENFRKSNFMLIHGTGDGKYVMLNRRHNH